MEAADTGPFFHHNGAATLEDAVAFYTTPAFMSSPIGALIPGGIQLDTEQISALGALLRTLNALENIRSSLDLGARARAAPDAQIAVRDESIALSVSELEDAIEVLEAKNLFPRARNLLRRAAKTEEVAARFERDQDDRILRAQELKAAARAEIVIE